MLGAGVPAAAQVLVGPGESTETAFRRQIRAPWFSWLAAHEEGDAELAASRVEEITRHARKIGVRRLTDMALAATLLARKELLSGYVDRAEASLKAAVALDPELPEARWGVVSVSTAAGRWTKVPGAVLAAVKATFADREARRVLGLRTVCLLAAAAAATGLALVLLLVLEYGRRLLHDLREIAARRLRPPLDVAAAWLALLLPLVLGLDLVWLAIALFVATWGYAGRVQKVLGAAGVLALVPALPLLDRVGYEMAVGASPILRGAEALAERRYDQRVLDDLEAVKNVLTDDVDVHFLLGRLYQSLGQNDRAVSEYTAGSRLSEADSRCLVNRGNIRFVDGDFGSAQEDFQKALERNARDVAARYNLSLVFAETFRTIEAAQTLQEARALDARTVQRYQDQPGAVKVVSLDYSLDEARQKVRALSGDARSRRLLGHFRTYRSAAAWSTPLLWAALLAVPGAVLLDRRRQRLGGYAVECQKCARTFCRRCKPQGESAMLCSQCVHVYLKKDGVSIETKLQKVEEVKRRRSLSERLRLALNLVLPGSAAFSDGAAARAVVPLTLFVCGVTAAAGWDRWVVSPRPGAAPAWAALSLPVLAALTGFVLGQLRLRRKG
ncbi:MAG: hypothetical protein EDX89_17110 [Acidobacteria bacterium]|nr:MAG: hypothetical protein EDX89_17110 [Acidobacteriota bacterium]